MVSGDEKQTQGFHIDFVVELSIERKSDSSLLNRIPFDVEVFQTPVWYQNLEIPIDRDYDLYIGNRSISTSFQSVYSIESDVQYGLNVIRGHSLLTDDPPTYDEVIANGGKNDGVAMVRGTLE